MIQEFMQNVRTVFKALLKTTIFVYFLGIACGYIYINQNENIIEKISGILHSRGDLVIEAMAKFAETNKDPNLFFLKDRGVLIFVHNGVRISLLVAFYLLSILYFKLSCVLFANTKYKYSYFEKIIRKFLKFDTEKTDDQALFWFLIQALVPSLILLVFSQLRTSFRIPAHAVLINNSEKLNDIYKASTALLVALFPHGFFEIGASILIASMSVALYITIRNKWYLNISEDLQSKHIRIQSAIKKIVLSRHSICLIVTVYIALFIAGQIEDKCSLDYFERFLSYYR